MDREESSILEDVRVGEVSTLLKKEEGMKISRKAPKLKYIHLAVKGKIRVYPINSHQSSLNAFYSVVTNF